MPWFAVRTVYLFNIKEDGTNVFEERVVCFEGVDADEACAKAQRESEEYEESNGFVAFPERDAHTLHDDPLIDGHEVWSVLLEAKLSLEDFYAARYAPYDYRPDGSPLIGIRPGPPFKPARGFPPAEA